MLLYTFESILYSTQASTDMITVFFHFPFISKVLSRYNYNQVTSQLMDEIEKQQLDEAILNIVTVGSPNITLWEAQLGFLIGQNTTLNNSLTPIESFIQLIDFMSTTDIPSQLKQSTVRFIVIDNLVTYDFFVYFIAE